MFEDDDKYPDRWCTYCLKGLHINQQWMGVDKHQHYGGERCVRPWTATCQTEHGDLCFQSNHTSQPEATARLDQHIRAGVHRENGSGDCDVETECRKPVEDWTV